MQNSEAKEKILRSACKLFAQKGFKLTTIRDICKDSGSYQISVNYYFGSKENLLKEAILKSYEYTNFDKISKKMSGLSFEGQLKEFLKARINATFIKNEKSWFFDILSKEFNIHTEIIQPLIPCTILHFLEAIKDILRGINPQADEFDIEYCCFLIISQSFCLALNPMAPKRLFNDKIPTESDIEILAEKMSFYIIQGLKKSNGDIK